MKRLALVLALLCWQGPAAAAPQVAQAWIRVLPGDLPLAGYLVLRNTGDRAITLSGVHGQAFGAIEMHRSLAQGGMQRYRSLEVAPGASLAFEPGGYHLMLFERRRPLQPGDTVTLTLEFADGSSLAVPFALREAGAR